MGEPVNIRIDDIIPYERVENSHFFRPMFAQLSQKTWSLWPMIIEKAWAKAKGNYQLSDFGFIENGIGFLTGVPTVRIKLAKHENKYRQLWNKMYKQNLKGYMHGTTTIGTDNTLVNEYGLSQGHAFDLIKPFVLRDRSGRIRHRLYMLRNPSGVDTF